MFDGVRQVESTREPFADWWEAANREALEADGPLWLVLGDSASQGLGASGPEAGYVPQVHARLREATGEPWRVLNLSITGARIVDVVDRQLPVAAALGVVAELVTCFVGANDLLFPWGIGRARHHARRLVDALPDATLQSRQGSGPISRPKAQAVNSVLREGAAAGRLQLFNPWAWPSRQGAWAADRFHPNDVGYGHLTEAIWPAVEDVVT